MTFEFSTVFGDARARLLYQVIYKNDLGQTIHVPASYDANDCIDGSFDTEFFTNQSLYRQESEDIFLDLNLNTCRRQDQWCLSEIQSMRHKKVPNLKKNKEQEIKIIKKKKNVKIIFIVRNDAPLATYCGTVLDTSTETMTKSCFESNRVCPAGSILTVSFRFSTSFEARLFFHN